jgi:hypothetical protein
MRRPDMLPRAVETVAADFMRCLDDFQPSSSDTGRTKGPLIQA